MKWDKEESNVRTEEAQSLQQIVAQPATRRHKILRATPGAVIIQFCEVVMHAIAASVCHASQEVLQHSLFDQLLPVLPVNQNDLHSTGSFGNCNEISEFGTIQSIWRKKIEVTIRDDPWEIMPFCVCVIQVSVIAVVVLRYIT